MHRKRQFECSRAQCSTLSPRFKSRKNTGISQSSVGGGASEFAEVENHTMFKWKGKKSSMPLILRLKGKEARVIDPEKSKSALVQKWHEPGLSGDELSKDKSIELVKSSALCNDADYLRPLTANNLVVVPFDKSKVALARPQVQEALESFRSLYLEFGKSEGKSTFKILAEVAELLKTQGRCVNQERRIGPVPGVDIGDEFYFRAELVIVGLHHQSTRGIDYVGIDGKKIAVSIVDSGRYANQARCRNVFWYVGEGGNPGISKTKVEDQKLKFGNVALKNSMEAGYPVRVIRGRPDCASQGGRLSQKRYFYDGLFIVKKICQERGEYGKLVFKFELHRLPDQPDVTQNMVCKRMNPRPKAQHIVRGDISRGVEKFPVRVINTLDDEKPGDFVYMCNMTYPEWCNRFKPVGCNCNGECSSSSQCSCALKNGGKIPSDCKGAVTGQQPVLYECGPLCKCSSKCKNRVIQHGPGVNLEVFKTENGRWGLMSRDFIRAGSFICEYVGELLRVEEIEKQSGADYKYPLYSWNCVGEPKQASLSFGSKPSRNGFAQRAGVGKLCTERAISKGANAGFVIDATHCGNVGRFIQCSNSPNIYAQKVLYDHHDGRFPHIMLFASRNIPPLQELTRGY